MKRKRKGIVLILVLSINVLFAQNIEGIAVYKKEITEFISEKKEFKIKNEKNTKYYNTVLNIDKTTKEIIKNIQFLLKFNKTESIFKVDNFLELESDRFYKVAIGSEGRKTYYTNLEGKENIHQIDAYGDFFLVKYPANKWVLSNESKQIGSYTCFKATTIKLVKNEKRVIEIPVEAWYVPEIAIPYGPIGYNGLPGLIVELSMRNYRYYLSKIEINNTKISIRKPSKGKEVTSEEFQEIGIKAMREYKKGY